MVVIFKLAEIDTVAQKLMAVFEGSNVIAFNGEMGAGKTTLIHSICKLFLVKDIVNSPTFSIINEYQTTDGKIIFHLDLYRLKDEDEAIAAGVEDCFSSGNLCLVEWPEKAAGIFPPETVHCYLKSISHNERKLQINL